LVWSFHNDGAEQTAYSGFVAFLSRLISLDEIARAPASVIRNGIDETKESSILFKRVWEKIIMPTIEKVKENGGYVSVLCVHSLDTCDKYHGTCKLCKLDHIKFGPNCYKSSSLIFHLVPLFFCLLHSLNIKAFKCLLPINKL